MSQRVNDRRLARSSDYQGILARSLQIFCESGEEFGSLVVASRGRAQRGDEIRRELLHIPALHPQAMLGVRPGQRELALDHIQAADLIEIRLGIDMPVLRKQLGRERRGIVRTQEIVIQRKDDFGFVELRMNVDRLPEGQHRAGALVLARKRFVLYPLCLGPLLQCVRAKTFKSRGNHALAQEPQS